MGWWREGEGESGREVMEGEKEGGKEGENREKSPVSWLAY